MPRANHDLMERELIGAVASSPEDDDMGQCMTPFVRRKILTKNRHELIILGNLARKFWTSMVTRNIAK